MAGGYQTETSEGAKHRRSWYFCSVATWPSPLVLGTFVVTLACSSKAEPSTESEAGLATASPAVTGLASQLPTAGPATRESDPLADTRPCSLIATGLSGHQIEMIEVLGAVMRAAVLAYERGAPSAGNPEPEPVLVDRARATAPSSAPSTALLPPQRPPATQVVPPSGRYLCGSSVPVPPTVPRGAYQPTVADFRTGDERSGWRCLRYGHQAPITFQIHYRQGEGYVGPDHGHVDPGPDGFEVAILADSDLDGELAVFTQSAYATSAGELVIQRFYSCSNPEE